MKDNKIVKSSVISSNIVMAVSIMMVLMLAGYYSLNRGTYGNLSCQCPSGYVVAQGGGGCWDGSDPGTLIPCVDANPPTTPPEPATYVVEFDYCTGSVIKRGNCTDGQKLSECIGSIPECENGWKTDCGSDSTVDVSGSKVVRGNLNYYCEPTYKCYIIDNEYKWWLQGDEPVGLSHADCTGCIPGYEKNDSDKCVKKEDSTPTDEGSCYLVNHEYKWLETAPSDGTAVSKSQAECVGCETGYEKNANNVCEKPTTDPEPVPPSPSSKETKSVNKCYQCDVNGKSKYVSTDSVDKAKQATDSNSCKVVDNYKCNIIVNPPTSTIAIIIAWIVGIFAIGFSIWYYFKNKSVKN